MCGTMYDNVIASSKPENQNATFITFIKNSKIIRTVMRKTFSTNKQRLSINLHLNND